MNQDQKLPTIISLVLMLATASLGWLTLRDQLALPPLMERRGSGDNPVSEQDVVARLWEDPLQAVQAEIARTKDNKEKVDPRSHKPDAFRLSVQRKAETGKRVCLLVVTIPGTSFPDDGEFRLRQRYSLVMALAGSGYQPDSDGRHLGYVTMNWLGQQGVHHSVSNHTESTSPGHAGNNARVGVTNYAAYHTNASSKSFQLPYEWYVSEEATAPEVLLVWLQDEFLVTEPLCRLAYVRHTLIPTNLPASNFAGIFLIGPDYSGALKEIVAGVTSMRTNEDHICIAQLRTNLCILSPLATAPDLFVGLTPTNLWSEARGSLDGLLREKLGSDTKQWTYFKNFIAPDDQLTDLLARELKLRKIDLTKGDDRALILAEVDTSYGRALPLAFLESVRSLGADFQTNSSPTATNLAMVSLDQATNNKNVVIARYLQGLDAQKGFQEGNKNGAKGTAGKSTAQLLEEALSKQAATAVGESQLDYSERLAQHLSEGEARGHVKAVGVLGGDVYDKLILLRSLRREFPQALFFTTDLDARLWHPDHLRFTRNLIVASAYPVIPINGAAEEKTGFKMAPFRNSYQMAVYSASRAALDLARGKPLSRTNAPAPQIYEIGRDGPVQLKPVDAIELRKGFWASLPAAAKQIPNAGQRGWIWVKRNFWAVLLALIGTILVIVTLRCQYSHRQEPDRPAGIYHKRKVRPTDWFGKRTGWGGQFLLGIVVMLAISAVVFRGAGLLPGGEPWSWSQGVSIWPTEMVRLVILASVSWMLVLACQRYDHHREVLEGTFFKVDQPAAPPPDCHNCIVAARLWDWYVEKASMSRRYIRAGVGALAYFISMLSLMCFTGLPFNTQVRGELAQGLDWGVTMASVGALLILLFYVLDAVWLSAKLLDGLAEPFTLWNVKLVNDSAAKFGVLEEDVEGHLDVEFAALKTEETGRVIFLPFIIQFFMLVSRNRYFDNWGWPVGLVAILSCNMVLAAAAWWLLRRSAAKVRIEALEKLSASLLLVEQGMAKGTAVPPGSQGRKLGLLEIKTRIEAEHRGAYSKWIQDPALLALLIPTGLLGVLTVLFQALFGL